MKLSLLRGGIEWLDGYQEATKVNPLQSKRCFECKESYKSKIMFGTKMAKLSSFTKAHQMSSCAALFQAAGPGGLASGMQLSDTAMPQKSGLSR